METPQKARVLVIVDQGVAMVHEQGNVEVCLIDFDCVRDGDLQEMPPEFEAAFPAQAKELREKTNEIGAWLVEQDA